MIRTHLKIHPVISKFKTKTSLIALSSTTIIRYNACVKCMFSKNNVGLYLQILVEEQSLFKTILFGWCKILLQEKCIKEGSNDRWFESHPMNSTFGVFNFLKQIILSDLPIKIYRREFEPFLWTNHNLVYFSFIKTF